ncbi:Laccase-2 [Dactylellina cionopaga]|nr:Laccase-2 [Dactylellina cionopaga]
MRLHDVLWGLFARAVNFNTPSISARAGEEQPAALNELLPRTASSQNSTDAFERSQYCYNSPEHRACWDGRHNLWSDYEDMSKVPKGVVRKFEFTITNGYIAPDGYNVSKMLVNGQYPGPPLEGNWGDTFEITVHNKLSNGNGTALHFHGVQQLGTNRMDGASGITQCPIPPGKSMTYKWRANQYGSSWYHSHFSLQYTDGVLGPIIIHGPTSVNYDEEYTLVLTDWFHTSAFTLFYSEVFGAPPIPDSKLLNGKWKFPCNTTDPRCLPDEGGYSDIVFEKGKKYKLRLINMSTTFMQTFWIDGHTFTVAASDFVPIEPYKTDVINVAVGQRYDVIVEANADISNQTDFWINMKTCLIPPGAPPVDCAAEDARTGIVRYDSTSTSDPPTLSNCADTKMCHDEPLEFIRPILKRKIPPPPPSVLQDLFVSSVSFPDDSVPWNESLGHKWNLANETFFVKWEKPTYTFLGLENGGDGAPFPESYQPVYLDVKDEWVYFVINANFTQTKAGKLPVAIDHPIHIHGHDFAVLAQVTNQHYGENPIKLNLDNPTRRDTAVLPGGGFLIVAFETKNPGAWLMHCHLAFHSSAGFSLQFIERQSEILDQFTGREVKQYHRQCEDWRDAWEENPARTELRDSGA